MFDKIINKLILPSCLSNHKLIQKLGEGRYGKTYLIERNESKYVYKKLKKINDKMGHKVKYEMKILSKLDHPNVPKLYGIVNDKNKFLLSYHYKEVKKPKGYIMEYIEGPTIFEMLFKQEYVFTNKEIWKVAAQLIDVIAYLQKNNIVHRDIRTPNVVKSGDKYYLLDFGLARPISKEEKYQYDIDFTYLADFLLYLFYSSFNFDNGSSKPWYEELDMLEDEKTVLKKMFGIDSNYNNVEELIKDIESVNKLFA